MLHSRNILRHWPCKCSIYTDVCLCVCMHLCYATSYSLIVIAHISCAMLLPCLSALLFFSSFPSQCVPVLFHSIRLDSSSISALTHTALFFFCGLLYMRTYSYRLYASWDYNELRLALLALDFQSLIRIYSLCAHCKLNTSAHVIQTYKRVQRVSERVRNFSQM